VIAPEAAAAILYRDPSLGRDLAERLRITPPDLVALGLVDRVIPEPPGGVPARPYTAMEQLASGVAAEITDLVALAPRRRLRQREKRWRSIARPSARASKRREGGR
jgi:acetyl-CoA carboxylase alpha subunit